MIFYNIYSTSISRYSQILKDPRLICKIPWPKKQCIEHREKLDEEYGKQKNEEENVEDITEDLFSTSLHCRILIYEALSKSLFIEETTEMKDLYKHYFKKDYKKENHSGIMKRADRLKLNYDVSTESAEVVEVDFDLYILKLEKILITASIDIWSKMLYQLPMYEDLALTMAQKNEEHERTE